MFQDKGLDSLKSVRKLAIGLPILLTFILGCSFTAPSGSNTGENSSTPEVRAAIKVGGKSELGQYKDCGLPVREKLGELIFDCLSRTFKVSITDGNEIIGGSENMNGKTTVCDMKHSELVLEVDGETPHLFECPNGDEVIVTVISN